MPLETRLRVRFLSLRNHCDRTEWSGTLDRMHRALRERGTDVVPLGNPMPRWKARIIGKLRGRARPKVGSAEFEADKRSRADRVAHQSRSATCDVLLAPVASTALAFFQTTIPIAFRSDATFRLLERTYPSAGRSESDAIARAAHLFYPSRWAADFVERANGAPQEKIIAVPLRANVDDPSEDRRDIPRLNGASPRRLLFVGHHWERTTGAW